MFKLSLYNALHLPSCALSAALFAQSSSRRAPPGSGRCALLSSGAAHTAAAAAADLVGGETNHQQQATGDNFQHFEVGSARKISDYLAFLRFFFLQPVVRVALHLRLFVFATGFKSSCIRGVCSGRWGLAARLLWKIKLCASSSCL